jgi:hypothetical protein
MRCVTILLLLFMASGSASAPAVAERSNRCKQCNDQRRACEANYSAKTCQTEYDRCIKECQRK